MGTGGRAPLSRARYLACLEDLLVMSQGGRNQMEERRIGSALVPTTQRPL